MNQCQANAAAAVVNGKIFCSGGYMNSSVECYDPSSDVWTLICNMPQKIVGHGAVEIDGNLIIMGGYSGGYTREDDERKTLDSVEICDGEVWRNGPKMPTDRYYAPAVVIPMSFARDLE